MLVFFLTGFSCGIGGAAIVALAVTVFSSVRSLGDDI